MRSHVIVLLLFLLLIQGCSKNEIVLEDNRWEGIVTIDDTKFFIHMKVEDDRVYLSIPELLATDVPVTDLSLSTEQWSFKIGIGTSVMRFLLVPQEEGFDGKILYDDRSGKVMLRPGRYSVEHRRLQQPQRIGKSVSIETAQGTLYGTHLIPEGEGPFPTVLIIAGSGPTDRDGNSELLVESNDSLWHLARQLYEAKIASIRYDKMGVGESIVDDESFLENGTFDDYVDHAVAWLDYLANESSAGAVGVVGHSEGSLIGLLAAKAFPIDFAISVAGNGDPIDRQMVKQIRRLDSEAAPILEKRLQEIAGSVYRETDNLLVDSLVPLGRERYLQTWMAYDPNEVLRSLDIPVLVVWGDRDERLVGEDDLFKQDSMPDSIQFEEISNMGHLLRWAKSDEDIIQAYKARDIPLHDYFIDTLITFINKQNKGDQ